MPEAAPCPAATLGGLTNKFICGGNPATLTLTGLTVGQTYTITFYDRSWEGAGTGTSIVTIASGSFSGLIKDNAGATTAKASVVKTGAGTLTLSGANTFTEELATNGGILNVASLSNYGVASAIGARTAAAETNVGNGIGLHFANGTLQTSGIAVNTTGTLGVLGRRRRTA